MFKIVHMFQDFEMAKICYYTYFGKRQYYKCPIYVWLLNFSSIPYTISVAYLFVSSFYLSGHLEWIDFWRRMKMGWVQMLKLSIRHSIIKMSAKINYCFSLKWKCIICVHWNQTLKKTHTSQWKHVSKAALIPFHQDENIYQMEEDKKY